MYSKGGLFVSRLVHWLVVGWALVDGCRARYREEEEGRRKCCKKEKESLVYKPIIINVAIRHRSLYLYGDANVTLADRHATTSSMIRMEPADFMPLLVELLVGLSYPTA